MKRNIKTFIFMLVTVLSLMSLVACAGKTYSVTFKNGEEVIEKVQVKENELVANKEISDEVHNFLGWVDSNNQLFDFNTPITSDLTLNATWTNTVKFINYDGSVIAQLEVAKGEEFSAPTTNPTKPSDDEFNYTFNGWNKTLIGTGTDFDIEANYLSSKIVYKVGYYDADKKLLKEVEVIKGQKVEDYVPFDYSDDYYDYTFKTWCTEDGKEFNKDTAIIRDTKLIAKYDRTPVERATLKGMKVSFMGASISTFYAKSSTMNSYYSGNDEFYYPKYSSTVTSVKQTWWYLMMNKLGLTLGVNQSLSGSAITVGAADRQARSYERIRAMGENGTPDIIILFIGINDNVSGVKTSDFEAGYKTMIDRTMEVYPNAYILLATFYYSHYHIREASHAQYSEETRLAYNEVIRDLAKEYQVGLVELADIWEAGVSPTALDAGSTGYLGDNLHPSDKGMKKLSEYFVADIKKYFGL